MTGFGGGFFFCIASLASPIEIGVDDAEFVLWSGLLGIGGASSTEFTMEDDEGVLCSGLLGIGGAFSSKFSCSLVTEPASLTIRGDL